MSLHPEPLTPVPTTTAQVAHAAFPQGHPYLRLRDELGTLFTDADFAPLFPTRGRPAEAPWRLAVVTILQFAEGLSDRRAADAVRSRIDWKYLLGLELTDAGFDSTVLSEFRSRLVAGQAEDQLLQTFLECCRERQWLTPGGRLRTDATHVLGAVRVLNRIECVGEALRQALNVLAVVAPAWLQDQIPAEWGERYGARLEEYRLPKGEAQRIAYAQSIGRDGLYLLQAVYAATAPLWLREVPAINTLRQVWLQHFVMGAEPVETGPAQTAPAALAEQLRWRTAEEGLPPAHLGISSPYDPEAHYAKKRSTEWVGYKVHLSETCEPDQPHLITHVATTPAPAVDNTVTAVVHQHLRDQGLLPRVHLVDTAYLSADLLVQSHQQHGVDLVGPPLDNYGWQARAGQGLGASAFAVDWEQRQVTCPGGQHSISWRPELTKSQREVVKVQFSPRSCGPCALREHCTRAPGRRLTLRPQEAHAALQAARARQGTAEYAQQYAPRAGIEGTLSQGVRGFGLRRARYVGQAKTHLQHVLTATALNLMRVADWLAGAVPARTRTSSFARLMTAAQPA